MLYNTYVCWHSNPKHMDVVHFQIICIMLVSLISFVSNSSFFYNPGMYQYKKIQDKLCVLLDAFRIKIWIC